MNQAEYNRLVMAARNRLPTLIRSTMRSIKDAYKLASDEVAAGLIAGGADSTMMALESISSQLDSASQIIAERLITDIPIAAGEYAGYYSAVDEKLLQDVINKAASDAMKIDGLENMYVSLNNRLIIELTNKVYQDGYILSDRCWLAGNDYREQVNRLVTSGFAQGRPLTDIAKDLERYTKEGAKVLPEGYKQAKYGDLIVKDVDWRALRLVRSELGEAQKAAAVSFGESNPACSGLYDWIRMNGQQHDCTCPDYAKNGPYKAADVPSQPHPNCMCVVRERLRNQNEFEADMKKWLNGESVDYLDEWYSSKYIPLVGNNSI